MGEHIRTALTRIRRSPYQALAAILVMSLMFFTVSIIAFLAYTAQVTLKYFETRPQIIAFLKNEASPEHITLLQQTLQSNPKVSGEVKFVSHEEALKIFENVVDNPLVTQLLPPEVFQASIEFSATDLKFAQELIENLKKENIVDQIEFTGSIGGENTISTVIKNLEQIVRYVRAAGVVLVSYLMLTAVLILVVIIGMRTASRKDEIEILRLIGASNWFIRLPFLFEAVIYGLIGVFIGFLASFLMLIYSIPMITRYFDVIPVMPEDFRIIASYLGILLSGEIILALIIGFIGSWIALGRYLRL